MTESLSSTELKACREIFGTDRFLTDPADCLAYGYDNSRRVAMPQAVAFAANHDEIAALLRVCTEHRIPLTARGRGTNTTGASVPIAGGIVLTLERMNRILRISPGDRMIECEAGALNGDIQAAAAKHGLFWAPDPTSAGFSSVGGNLACSSGGPRAVKYGTARDNVLGLRAITGTGTSIKTGCYTTKGVVGYDLTRLLIGSEGTLAVITEATLKLLPKPEVTRTLRAAYRDVKSAAEAVARLMGQPQIPSALEFMDGDAVMLAQQHQDSGVPQGTGALLLIEADGAPDSIESAVRAISDAARGDGLIELRTAASSAEAEALWSSRKALSPALRKLAPKKVNEDVAVPVTRLPELIDGLGELSRRHSIRIVNFGHAGNGNIHVNLLADPSDAMQMKAIEACLHDVFKLVLSLEGTISGEHGVGIDKRDYVGWEIDADTLALMRQLKQVFDPQSILNPGKTLPP
ncbi:FAD-binding oxidoreductase [Stenotrophobium rhamnosiphilum]|uniref:FAD-binding oxidoreductase n=1 Tax=Stenotrophobium rhamnosiphilum TaxID=2029166 RepID=A0A2T5MJE7_9GAMM|nr:FAD-linked oxidase C-terminal domain-containing protein [Stenotrophobium rhamnosiphilum]PTU32701.1 FAD-binding oxidoreductase [Stenotrophobium rhamnosiphilum]